MSETWPDDVPRTNEIKEPNKLGTRSVADTSTQFGSGEPFRDTFTGPRDKKLLDFYARQMSQLRGTNVWYYVLKSQTQRTDGITPDTVNPAAGPFDQTRHAGGRAGISAMYGEPIIVGGKINGIEREVSWDWDFADPVEIRGVLRSPERSEDPDERGSIYIRRIRLSLARVLCEKNWNLRPQIGDMVRLPNTINDYYGIDGQAVRNVLTDYYDVEEVVKNDSRFGSTGFFTNFDLQLVRSSRHAPERKIPVQQQRPSPEPPV